MHIGSMLLTLLGLVVISPEVLPAPAPLRADGVMRGSAYWEKRGAGRIVYAVPTNKPLVALTFDDGPHPQYTPQILAILRRYHARATFFVIGESVRRYPFLLTEIVRAGHEIGNHTDTHPASRLITRREITDCDASIWVATGFRPILFRPPGGRLTEKVLATVELTRHLVIMWTWDTDTKDWSRPGVRRIVERAIHHTHPGDIVLLHDGGGGRKQTVSALPHILEELMRQGVHFVTVSELLRERPGYKPYK